jgi:putative transposase
MAYHRRTRNEWQSLVQEQFDSGQSAKTFCTERGIGVASFYQWRKRLGSSEVGEISHESLPFVDVSALAAQAGREVGAASWLMELDLNRD